MILQEPDNVYLLAPMANMVVCMRGVPKFWSFDVEPRMIDRAKISGIPDDHLHNCPPRLDNQYFRISIPHTFTIPEMGQTPLAVHGPYDGIPREHRKNLM